MKANEAPERIWIDLTTDLPKLSGHIDKDSIKYTRTDAFIEKAVSYIQQHWIWNTKIIEDFRKYMKGE